MNPESHTFQAAVDCHYLLHVPERPAGRPHSALGRIGGPSLESINGETAVDLGPIPERAIAIVAVHGYGMNAGVMLRLTAGMVGEDKLIASLEGPNQFYSTPNQPGSEIAFNWGTRAHWESAIRLHHEMLLRVLRELRQRFGVPPARSVVVGYSQPVGLNYRFAATHPEEVAGVVGICGGVPRDFEQRGYSRITAALLHIAREQDEFYPAEVAVSFPERLRKYADDVEFHLLPGTHRFPSKARQVVQPWLERIIARQPPAAGPV